MGLHTLIGWLEGALEGVAKLPAKIIAFLKSDKAKQYEHDLATILPKALEVVQEIAIACPNRVSSEIEAVAAKYGVAVTQELSTVSPALALLDLAKNILFKLFPTISTGVLHEAIEKAFNLLNLSGSLGQPQ